MRYVIKQKILAVGGDFEVFDQHGNLVYYFDGKVFSIGTKIIVLSDGGKEVARIRRKLFSLRPTFVVRRGRQEIARIYKKLFTVRNSFFIDVPGPDDITVTGSFLEHNYSFHRNNQQIAEVSKRWFTMKDTYGVEIESGGDALLILSCAVIVDILCHKGIDSGFNTSK